jgi:6-hydroxycyclohex-1-ene-1-carbonyl-CoA dehydrogenase
MARSLIHPSRATPRQGWRMTAPTNLEWFDDTLPPPAAGQAVVRVAGCGLCHTDLGFYAEGVRTRHPLPLVLGHEISGFVEAAGHGAEPWVGQAVVVPAVIPCGHCALCLDGFGAICATQIMPGNDADGGFASHVTVPAHGLCPVPGCDDPDQPLGASGVTLRQLAVIADAVSTPWQAVLRSGLGRGDLAIVVGAGGVGGYAVQIARALGAHVVAIDPSEARRAAVKADLVLDPGTDDCRRTIRAAVKERGWPATRWRIFECSGRAAGQRTAFDLLNPGATLMVVGFTRDAVELRLSNLMAFDATARGTWGCLPEHYPAVVKMALEGAIDLASQTEIRPLASLPQTLDAMHHGRLSSRAVLAPET